MDDMDLSVSVALTQLITGHVAGVKYGFELLCIDGADRIMSFMDGLNVPVFLDPKLHDIPNTAAKAAKKLARLGVWIINVHCSGGAKMMEAVRAAVDEVWEKERDEWGLKIKPLVIGVTVLTSHNWRSLADVGFFANEITHAFVGHEDECFEKARIESVQALTVKLARLAQASGLDGVVSSPQEAQAIRQACGPTFQIVTPGIRLQVEAGTMDDQVRIATPAGAILAGADWLVIGRPVTKSENAVATLKKINLQVADALAQKH